MTVEVLNSALDLWRRGLGVIPVPRADGRYDGKTPAFKWTEYQHRLPTEEEIRRWFSRPCNIAVVTGRISGVVVIDLDSRDAILWARRSLPFTPWQTKTARGFHIWYRHPGVPVRNRARLETHTNGRLAVDVRADGGIVIAPGSVHATGALYGFTGDWTKPRERLPVFWPGWIERPRPKHEPTHATTKPIAVDLLVERARRYLAAIPKPVMGNGSDNGTFYAACRLVRGFGLREAVAIELLWEWAGRDREGWTHDWIAAKVRSAAAYGTEPVGGLQ